MGKAVRFKVVPYAGTDLLEFGSNVCHANSVFGEPILYSTNRRNEHILNYEFFTLGFRSDNKLNHYGFVFGAKVSYKGFDLLTPDGFSSLCNLDGRPMTVVGFVVLLRLGIAFSGHEKLSESGRTASLFGNGAYEPLVDKMTPY